MSAICGRHPVAHQRCSRPRAPRCFQIQCGPDRDTGRGKDDADQSVHDVRMHKRLRQTERWVVYVYEMHQFQQGRVTRQAMC